MLLAAYMSLRTVTGQSLDDESLAQAKADRVYFPQSVLGVAQVVPEVLAISAGVLALVWTVRTRRWIPALCAVGAVLGANLTTQILKHGILDKPDLGVQQLAHNSLPSGHTTATASLLLAALLVAPPHLRPRAAAWGALLAALTGMLTVLNGWHRPSDAVAALLVVGAWGALAVAAMVLAHRAVEHRGARENSGDTGESAYLPPAGFRYPNRSAPEYALNRHRAPLRPRTATVITLGVLAVGLGVAVVLAPSAAVAGTLTGRITLLAGYLGIAAASALSWHTVARWLRSRP